MAATAMNLNNHIDDPIGYDDDLAERPAIDGLGDVGHGHVKDGHAAVGVDNRATLRIEHLAAEVVGRGNDGGHRSAQGGGPHLLGDVQESAPDDFDNYDADAAESLETGGEVGFKDVFKGEGD